LPETKDLRCCQVAHWRHERADVARMWLWYARGFRVRAVAILAPGFPHHRAHPIEEGSKNGRLVSGHSRPSVYKDKRLIHKSELAEGQYIQSSNPFFSFHVNDSIRDLITSNHTNRINMISCSNPRPFLSKS
jgi:hypothetical protein